MDTENSQSENTKQPYDTTKRVAAAEVVLGPQALNRIISGIVRGFSDLNVVIDRKLAASLNVMLRFIDEDKQIVIRTGVDFSGGLDVVMQPKEASIAIDLQAYALVDIQTVLAAAVTDDLTGLVLQALQAKWNRDLSLDEAKNITIHLTKLIQLLT